MYIIEIKDKPKPWIVAITHSKENSKHYFSDLKKETQDKAECYEIPLREFPLVLIENCATESNSDSYFEFVTLENLSKRIDDTKKEQTEDDEFIYFKYYFFDDEFFQSMPNEDFLKYQQHTFVTNDLLQQKYSITIFHEKIKQFASSYDVESLDKLFDATKTIYTSDLEKEDLAENGYSSLFGYMNYDFACGKLSDLGISFLLPMVEKMEILSGGKKWMHRSFVQLILLENACKNKDSKVTEILTKTIEAFRNYEQVCPEEKEDIQQQISCAYTMVLESELADPFLFWQLSYNEIRKDISGSSEYSSWAKLLELLYMPYPNVLEISFAQEAGKNRLNQELCAYKTNSPEVAYRLALAFDELRKQLAWKKVEGNFPLEEFLYWANEALNYCPDSISRLEVMQAGQFFSHLGEEFCRIDFLKKSISFYERVLKVVPDCSFEVYYIANLWKLIAEIQLQDSDQTNADSSMQQAILVYKNNFKVVNNTPSTYMHYADFQEYCFHYPGEIEKPSLAQLREIAQKVELESEGFYSQPYLMLHRIALLENNETEAIHQLTKSMVLHELCADGEIDSLLNQYEQSQKWLALLDFLKKTKIFMEEVSGNYYDPEIRWKEISILNPEALAAYWEKRKTEIQNREPLNS